MATPQTSAHLLSTPAAAADAAPDAAAQHTPQPPARVGHAVRPARPHSQTLKVSASSKPTLVAGAIAGMLRERGRAEIQAIGAGAINQVVKAVAIARGYLAPEGVDAVCIPSFVDVTVEAGEKTAMRFIVEPR
jgi:stage V sporulation protein S